MVALSIMDRRLYPPRFSGKLGINPAIHDIRFVETCGKTALGAQGLEAGSNSWRHGSDGYFQPGCESGCLPSRLVWNVWQS